MNEKPWLKKINEGAKTFMTDWTKERSEKTEREERRKYKQSRRRKHLNYIYILSYL